MAHIMDAHILIYLCRFRMLCYIDFFEVVPSFLLLIFIERFALFSEEAEGVVIIGKMELIEKIVLFIDIEVKKVFTPCAWDG